MPCWEVNTVSLDFNAKNLELMIQTLQEMGITVHSKNTNYINTSIGTFDLRSGKVDVERRYRRTVNDFRVNYSKNVVKAVAKKKKWVLKQRSQKVFVAKKW